MVEANLARSAELPITISYPPSSCMSGTACLITCEISLFQYCSKPGRHFARNLRKFGVARSEELEVNQ